MSGKQPGDTRTNLELVPTREAGIIESREDNEIQPVTQQGFTITTIDGLTTNIPISDLSAPEYHQAFMYWAAVQRRYGEVMGMGETNRIGALPMDSLGELHKRFIESAPLERFDEIANVILASQSKEDLRESLSDFTDPSWIQTIREGVKGSFAGWIYFIKLVSQYKVENNQGAIERMRDLDDGGPPREYSRSESYMRSFSLFSDQQFQWLSELMQEGESKSLRARIKRLFKKS
ncbi:hypothetical protein KJ742_02185 [Patescibacteria group bacterium]|nr:hypothetical protein [Patescibacteria group bacterium]MBU1682731.1 hypothetical protein [Patescibacteria group bacterium]MBU1934891.1 hypothetical protein [Patescibacteria group bacterium]